MWSKNKKLPIALANNIADIVQDPLNCLRIEFSNLFFRRQISAEYIHKLAAEIEGLFTDKDLYNAHALNFKAVLTKGDIRFPLNLADETSQFFWGAVLAYIQCNPNIQTQWPTHCRFNKISQSTLWRRIASSSHMKREIKNHAFIIQSSLGNPNTKIVWSEPLNSGYPNIGYCYSPDDNLIVDDMLWSLIVGVPNAATAINHEIAHSKGTIGLTPKITDLTQKLEQIRAAAVADNNRGDEKACRDKTAEALKIQEEIRLRYYFYDELENMYANRYAVNFGGDIDKHCLNIVETCICGTGYQYLTGTLTTEEFAKKSNVNQTIDHIKRAARYSFFCNNDLINDNLEEWHSIGIYPELLHAVDEQGHPLFWQESFKKLRDMCDRMEKLQPSKVLRLLNEKSYNHKMILMSAERQKISDSFFDSFVLPYFNDIIQKLEQQQTDNRQNTRHLQEQLNKIMEDIEKENSLQDISNNGRQSGSGQQSSGANGNQGEQSEQSGTESNNASGNGGQSSELNDSQSGSGQQSSSTNGSQGEQSEQSGTESNNASANGGQSSELNDSQSGSGRQPSGANGAQGEQTAAPFSNNDSSPAEVIPASDEISSASQLRVNEDENKTETDNSDEKETSDTEQLNPPPVLPEGNWGPHRQDTASRETSNGEKELEAKKTADKRYASATSSAQNPGKTDGDKSSQANAENGRFGHSARRESNKITQDGNSAQLEKATDYKPNIGSARGKNEKMARSDNLSEILNELEPSIQRGSPKIDSETLAELLKHSEEIRELTNSGEEEVKNSDSEKTHTNGDINDDTLPERWGKAPNSSNPHAAPVLVHLEEMQRSSGENARFYREGNLNAYEKMIAPWEETILKVRYLLQKIIQQQKMLKAKKAKSKENCKRMEVMPTQGAARLSISQQITLMKKIQNKDPSLSMEDFKRFKNRHQITKEIPSTDIEIPTIDVGLLIDGSGSMSGAPFENALAIGCIIFEAARQIPEIQMYIYMMGEPNPLNICRPGDEGDEIARKLESVRQGQGGCNDHLIPAVQRLLKDVARNKAQTPHQKSGFTHIFSVTDGGNCDYSCYDVNGTLREIIDSNPYLTFDSFFIDTGNPNYTKPFIASMKQEGCKRIDYVDDVDNLQKVPQKIYEMLCLRMQNTKLENAPDNEIKLKLIQDALSKIL